MMLQNMKTDFRHLRGMLEGMMEVLAKEQSLDDVPAPAPAAIPLPRYSGRPPLPTTTSPAPYTPRGSQWASTQVPKQIST